jgi:GGDEF domain-containing protein
VLRPDVPDGSGAEALAEAIVETVNAPLVLAGGAVLAPSISVGIRVTGDSETDPTCLLRDADAAMYQVKHAGGGGIAAHGRGVLRAAAVLAVNEPSTIR